MKRPASLLLFLFFFYVSSQVSNRTAAIVKPIGKYSSFSDSNENIKQIEDKLFKEASPEELMSLVEDGKTVYVKAIAVNVLARKGEGIKILELFKRNLHSEEKLVHRTTCLSSEYPLSIHIFESVSISGSFSEEEKENLEGKMVSLALNAKPINRELLEALSYGMPINADNYSKIRALVIETKSPMLLTALANYKNPNDIELIKSFGKEAYPAIENFPDPKFLPFMKEHIKDSSEYPFMFALAKFCSEEAKEIVIKAIEYNKELNKGRDCGNECLSFLYQQIDKEKCNLYAPVLADLWITDKIISFDILDSYEKTHTQSETEKFLLNGFSKSGEAEIIAANAYDVDQVMDYVSGDMTFDGNLRLAKLLEKTKKISQEAYKKGVRNSLQYIDDLDFDRFISKLKDNASVLQNKDILLDRLKNNETAYGTLIIMDGIKMLNDKKLFNEGAAIVISRKKEFEKSQVWEKSYRNFIKENNIKE
ncbi:hypothetical protein [Chryseobacterium shigense]|uniref:HEAT repeat-containing protein n=1 Tax=Chryseobacterium shigense TaxID=297244 RepID=A0A841N1S9_9FLAO|nr:hypothetical protein [Chryseobacterium shigense]MBB6369103.1 hypothetical protein [Chryseobacterium shigense]